MASRGEAGGFVEASLVELADTFSNTADSMNDLDDATLRTVSQKLAESALKGHIGLACFRTYEDNIRQQTANIMAILQEIRGDILKIIPDTNANESEVEGEFQD